MAKVVIMRGLPGTGKSTYVQERLGRLDAVCSTDGYPGLYDDIFNIDFSKLSDAHDDCFRRFSELCERASSPDPLVSGAIDTIYVDNTNTTLAEMAPYRMVARRHKITVEFVAIYVPWTNRDGQKTQMEMLEERNIHNVPAHTIRNMAKRWENLPTFWGLESFVQSKVD